MSLSKGHQRKHQAWPRGRREGSVVGSLCLLCGRMLLGGDVPSWSGSKTQMWGFAVRGFIVRFLCTFESWVAREV